VKPKAVTSSGIEAAFLSWVARENPEPAARPSVDFSGVPLADRLWHELAQPLTDLALQARRRGPREGGTVLLLTGCRRGAGCSTVALALAQAAATEMPVLLAEGDLDRPGLSALSGTQAPFGWEEVVRGQCSFAEALHGVDRREGLAFFPLKQPVADPGRLWAHPALQVWLAQLRQTYGLVVLDGGPAGQTGCRWAARADVAVLVCDAGRQPGYDWAPVWDRLEEGGAEVLGIVETFV
jgi:Mrp family chromosome partitioning ATPase